MPVAARRRFTADEYQRMGQTAILRRTDRVELIDGEVLAMTPIGTRHSATVDKVNRLLVTRAGEAAIVRVQSTVRLDLTASRSRTSCCCGLATTSTRRRIQVRPTSSS